LIADLTYRRCTATALTIKNKVYIFGGYSGSVRLNSVEVYDENKNTWSVIDLLLSKPIEAGITVKLSESEIMYISGKDDVTQNPNSFAYTMLIDGTWDAVPKKHPDLIHGNFVRNYSFFRL
jgi:N-acetylneuraminic acid mutarotase